MTETVRTILIVEDQERWKKRIKRYCRSVHQELYRTDANIISVSNLCSEILSYQGQMIRHLFCDMVTYVFGLYNG